MSERRWRSGPVFEPTAEEDVRRELQYHLDERVAALVKEGLTEAEARARAEREFGPVEVISAQCEGIVSRQRRAHRRWSAIEGARLDLRDGLRQLRRRPWVSAAVICVVALAVATTLATTGLVWSTLLRPLPLPSAERIMAIHTVDARVERAPLRGSSAGGDVIDWRGLDSFEAIAALNSSPVTILAGNDPERILALLVSQDIARVLRVRAHLGRMFADEDWSAGAGSVVMVTHDYWRRAFGADSALVGRVIQFGGGSAEVIGVLPPLPRLSAELQGDVWLPFDVMENPSRGGTWLRVIGRLDEEVTLASAQAELDAMMSRLANEEAPTNGLRTAWIEPLASALTWSSRPVLGFVSVAITFVVLIACANVAVLLLGVASERNGELALRAALGAGPAGLGRLFLAESLVCCGVGAALGLPLAGAAVRVFLGVYPGGLPRADEVAGGAVVWGAGAALVLVLIALATLPQHRRARRLDIGSALMSGGRVSSDRRAARFRATLVVFQLTLCTCLLTVGTLLVRLYLETVATPPGFASEEVVAFNVTPPSARYTGQPEYLAFYDDLLQRIRAQPGVRAASYTSLLPFDRDDWREGFVREGAPDEPEEELFVLFQRVEPSYTEVLGLPLLAGRRLTDSDLAGTPRVGLVNEALARRWFGGTDAIGKRIGRGDRWIEIVGVVGDKRHRDLSQEPLLELFVPRRQETGIRSMWIVVRSSEDPSLLLGRMREVLHQTDPSIPFAYATVMTDRIALSTAPQRFRSLLLASLAGMALLLATLGVWGLSSFRVGRETRDIGVRLALGMSPARARARVLGTALLTAVPGVTVGALLTLLTAQLVDASLFGVPEIDPVSLLGAPAFLIVVTVATALRPAWRAGSVDPIRTMRSS